MAAINVNGTVAYNVLPGSMNKNKLFWWTYICLIPKLSPYPGPNSVLVLDNVSFHRSIMFKALCMAYGIKIIYLPPYSPHLNVIELLFNAIKTNLKKYQIHCRQDPKLCTELLMELKLNHIDWRPVARRIGYHHHCRGL